jgi:hypothetical protein
MIVRECTGHTEEKGGIPAFLNTGVFPGKTSYHNILKKISYSLRNILIIKMFLYRYSTVV